MVRKKKLYEVVVLLTRKQLIHLYKTYPKEWRFTRQLIEWYVGENQDQMPNRGVPIKELIEDGEDIYAAPQDGYGVPSWRVKAFRGKKLKQ